jgi:hypothetical protein
MANETLKHERVWFANPAVNKADFPGVNWDDKQAIMNDPRLGSWVDAPVFSIDDADIVTAGNDGDFTAAEMGGNGATLRAVAFAGLGAFALLLL